MTRDSFYNTTFLVHKQLKSPDFMKNLSGTIWMYTSAGCEFPLSVTVAGELVDIGPDAVIVPRSEEYQRIARPVDFQNMSRYTKGLDNQLHKMQTIYFRRLDYHAKGNGRNNTNATIYTLMTLDHYFNGFGMDMNEYQRKQAYPSQIEVVKPAIITDHTEVLDNYLKTRDHEHDVVSLEEATMNIKIRWDNV